MLQAIGAILLGMVLLFFALTRTQVGRNELGRRLEAQFSRTFEGRLQIGHLSGNLINTLFASDVRVLAPDGSEVVHVDSVIVEPAWTSVLRKSFSVHRISLLSPNIQVIWSDSGTTDFAAAFKRRSVGNPDSISGWTFRGAHLLLEAGELHTSSPAYRPRTVKNGLVSDYTNLDVTAISVDANIDWRQNERQVDILDFTAGLPAYNLAFSSGATQLLFNQDRIVLSRLGLKLGESDITMAGHVDLPLTRDRVEDLPFLVDIEESGLNFDQLSKLFPRLPLHGRAHLTTHIQGPVSDLTVSWMRIQSGESRLALDGTFFGMPDLLDFEFSVSESAIHRDDLLALWPAADSLMPYPLRQVSAGAYAVGTVVPGPEGWRKPATVELSGNASLFSGGGSLSSTFDIAGVPGDSLRHDIRLRTDNLDLYPWTGRSNLSSLLTGNLRLTGYGMDPGTADTDLTVRFNNPELGDHSAGSVDAEVSLSQGLADLDITVRSSGTASIKGVLDLNGLTPLLDMEVGMEQLNVGPLLGRSEMRTSLNGIWKLRTGMTTSPLLNLQSTLALTQSDILVADSAAVIPAMEATLLVRPPDITQPTVQLASDIADLEIHSELDAPSLLALARGWLAAFRAAAAEESAKSRANGLLPDGPAIVAAERDRELLTAASTRFRSATNARSIQTDVVLELKHPEQLSFLWPLWTPLRAQGEVESHLQWSPDFLEGTASIQLNNLGFRGLRTEHMEAQMSATSLRSRRLLRSTALEGVAHADSISWNDIGVSAISTRLSADLGKGEWNVTVPETAGVDSIRVSGGASLLDATNQITLNQILVHTGSNRWNLEQPAHLDFYSDATQIDSLLLAHEGHNGRSTQAIRAWGTLSSLPSDSLHFDFDNLLLVDLSDYLNARRAFGGRLNSAFVLTGGRSAPRIQGQLDIERASLDRRILGDVRLTSDFIAGSPDIAIDMLLSPASDNEPAVIIGTDRSAEIVQNELRVDGSILLPGKSNNNEGALALDVDIERLDLFFFKYIFEEALGAVGGYVTGDGSVTGSFRMPEPDLSLAILDGRFFVPRTQVEYTLRGEARIDQEAIHLDSARLTDSVGGTGVVTGRLNFNQYRFFTLDLEGTMQEMQIMNVGASSELPFYGFLYVTATFDLDGPLFDATLSSGDLITAKDSELFIPIVESGTRTDESFIVFEDSVGVIPDFSKLVSRPNILSRRPSSERQFLDALNMDLNITAPSGSIVHLVIDPLLGDVINAESNGEVQFQRLDGQYFTFGQLEVTGGDYLFTAGEVFVRRFRIEEGGTITWNGDPINAVLDIPASYRTRASRAGLQGTQGQQSGLIPVIVQLQISGTVTSPQVDLSLAVDRTNQNVLGDYQALDARLNQPDRAAEYATSVLLTNSFQLTTENLSGDSGSQLAFNSVSQLVSAQLNRFLNEALPNVDFSFGLLGETAQDLDVTYGVALRLLDERLIIRGEGIYQGRTTDNVRTNEGLQGEFVVEVRLNPSVSVEVFFRREGDILNATELTNTTGLGLSYQTEFQSWISLIKKIFVGREN